MSERSGNYIDAQGHVHIDIAQEEASTGAAHWLSPKGRGPLHKGTRRIAPRAHSHDHPTKAARLLGDRLAPLLRQIGRQVAGQVRDRLAEREKLAKQAPVSCETIHDVNAATGVVDRNPSRAEIEAGNYRKAHVRLMGLDISIENPRGSTRRGMGRDGKPWAALVPDHYGYLRGTTGHDGDQVDVTIGHDHESRRVYVIDQHEPETGGFDEQKCFVWFPTLAEAVRSYDASFSDGSGPRRRRRIRIMAPGRFKAWLAQTRQQAKIAKASRGDSIAAGLDLNGFDLMIDVTAPALADVAAASGRHVVGLMGVLDEGDLVNQVNDRAVAWSNRHAADLVGKSYDQDGNLIDNPDSRYAVTDTTRDQLRETISDGLAAGLSADEIGNQIEESGLFDERRAHLIANTEITRANSAGALEGYRTGADAGLTVKKFWIVDGDPCQVCIDNEAAGEIELDDLFPSGDSEPGAHPWCMCALGATVDDGSGDDSEGEIEEMAKISQAKRSRR